MVKDKKGNYIADLHSPILQEMRQTFESQTKKEPQKGSGWVGGSVLVTCVSHERTQILFILAVSAGRWDGDEGGRVADRSEGSGGSDPFPQASRKSSWWRSWVEVQTARPPWTRRSSRARSRRSRGGNGQTFYSWHEYEISKKAGTRRSVSTSKSMAVDQATLDSVAAILDGMGWGFNMAKAKAQEQATGEVPESVWQKVKQALTGVDKVPLYIRYHRKKVMEYIFV